MSMRVDIEVFLFRLLVDPIFSFLNINDNHHIRDSLN